jgi:hypothetical protein
MPTSSDRSWVAKSSSRRAMAASSFTWECIFYGEFDGRRRKRVLVKIIGEYRSSSSHSISINSLMAVLGPIR